MRRPVLPGFLYRRSPLVLHRSPCVPVAQTKNIDNGCKWVKFITASPDDTPETKSQIVAHDWVSIANCPNEPR